MAFFKGDIHSNVLQVETGLTVVLPHDVTEDHAAQCPVIYLLHGYGNNSSKWSRNTSVERYAVEHGFAVVMPEIQNNFYHNFKFGEEYFSYIAIELPQIVGRLFNVSTAPEDTYIGGLSMGGFGALKCMFSYPEKYAGCAAFSSLVGFDFIMEEARRDTTGNMKRKLQAAIGFDLKVSDDLDLLALAKKADKDKLPPLFMTCGTEDYMYEDNIRFITQLKNLEIPHCFEQWSGEHCWDFWDESVKKALAYFSGIREQSGE